MPRIEPHLAIVSDNRLTAEALKEVLRAHPRLGSIDVVASVAPQEIEQTLADSRPTVVLLEVELAAESRRGLSVLVSRIAGRANTVVLTGERSEADLGSYLSMGAISVVSKADPLDALVEAVVRAADGSSQQHEHRRQLLEAFEQRRRVVSTGVARLAALTPSEEHVLHGLMQGVRVMELANLRSVSETTIRAQVRSVLTKLEVQSQLAAVSLAFRCGWEPEGK